jgi:hypothetical protein
MDMGECSGAEERKAHPKVSGGSRSVGGSPGPLDDARCSPRPHGPAAPSYTDEHQLFVASQTMTATWDREIEDMASDKPGLRENDRIDLGHDYAVCAWARHFNVSERQVREAVQAVGDRALRVREHLRQGDGRVRSRTPGRGERPSGF